jgi:NAD dependent epimerase/dehydratase
MTQKTYLVTGADGFIGSHLCELLVAEGHAVRAFVYYNSFGTWGWLDTIDPEIRDELDVVMGDVRDPFHVNRAVAGTDIVLHLAALIGIPYSYVAPQSYVDTNTTGTLNDLEAVRSHGIERLVHTSTSEVYGTALFTPITEEHPLQGQSPYSASKIGADQMALAYHRSFGLPVAVMRPFNTYGPRQSTRAVIPTIITQVLNGATSVRLGSTHPTRDFNYVADTARGFAMMGATDAGVGTVTNFGSNFEISIGQTVDAIAEAVGRPIGVEVDADRLRPEGSEVDRLWADNTRARELVGWTPEYGGLDGFQRGIAETVEWFSIPANRAAYNSDRYMV